MIDRVDGQVRLICDNDCGEATELFDGDDFAELVKEAKKDGWVIEKDEYDEFVHWCPDCT